MAGRRRPGGKWRGARARGAEGLGLGVLRGDWVGGWGQGFLGGPSGVGAEVGEGDVGVATTTAWTRLGAKLLGDGNRR